MKPESAVIREVPQTGLAELADAKGILLFTVLTIAGAKVYIPHEPVPFTLQTLFVVLSGAFLGWRNGTISMLIYILLGAAGIPVFAGPVAGPSVLFGTTAGYLFGFVVSAGVVGILIDYDSSPVWTLISMTAGFLVIFTMGTIWLHAYYIHNWQASVSQGFLIFSFWDLVKLGAAVAVYRTLSPRFHAHDPK